MANTDGTIRAIVVAVVIALIAGGSAPWWWGKLFPSRVPSPVPSSVASATMSDLEVGIDRNGGEDYSDFASPSAQACSDSCLKDPKCKSFVFHLGANQCWLKTNVPRRIENREFISGVKIEK